MYADLFFPISKLLTIPQLSKLIFWIVVRRNDEIFLIEYYPMPESARGKKSQLPRRRNSTSALQSVLTAVKRVSMEKRNWSFLFSLL